MKSLNIAELDHLTYLLQSLVGAQLQAIVCNDNLVVLDLRVVGNSVQLIFDLNVKAPMVVVGQSYKLKKKVKPIGIFLNSNFKNQRINSVERVKAFGRVLRIGFLEGYAIEFVAIPHGVNLIAYTPEKQLSWNKIKELEGKHFEAPDEVTEFTMQDLFDRWLGSKKQPTGDTPKNSPEKLLEKKRKKLEKSIAKVEMELEKKKQAVWQQVGEQLVSSQNLNVSQEFQEYVDSELTLSENIQLCFKKSKENKIKIEGTEERLKILKKELAGLTLDDIKEVQDKNSAFKKSAQKKEVKARKLVLDDGSEVYWGKTAKENINILRSAKPWHQWYHLKDIPGAHAILLKNKNQTIPDKVNQQIAQWLCHMTFGAKTKSRLGDRFEVITAECRFVKPIKGDKLGRVNYSNEKIFAFKLSK